MTTFRVRPRPRRSRRTRGRSSRRSSRTASSTIEDGRSARSRCTGRAFLRNVAVVLRRALPHQPAEGPDLLAGRVSDRPWTIGRRHGDALSGSSAAGLSGWPRPGTWPSAGTRARRRGRPPSPGGLIQTSPRAGRARRDRRARRSPGPRAHAGALRAAGVAARLRARREQTPVHLPRRPAPALAAHGRRDRGRRPRASAAPGWRAARGRGPTRPSPTGAARARAARRPRGSSRPALQGIYASPPGRAVGVSHFRASAPAARQAGRAAATAWASFIARLHDAAASSAASRSSSTRRSIGHRSGRPTVICTNAPAAARLLAPHRAGLAAAIGRIRMVSLVTATAFYRAARPNDCADSACSSRARPASRALGVLFNADIFAGRSTLRSETWIYGNLSSAALPMRTPHRRGGRRRPGSASPDAAIRRSRSMSRRSSTPSRSTTTPCSMPSRPHGRCRRRSGWRETTSAVSACRAWSKARRRRRSGSARRGIGKT